MGVHSPFNHAMLSGLELGIFFGLNFILTAEAQGRFWLGVLSWMLTLYIIYGVFRSALHYRMTECEGEITYMESFRYIVWLFVFASIVATLVRVVYLKWIDSSYLSELLVQTNQVLEQLKLSAGDRSAVEESLKNMLQPVRFSLYYMLYDVFMGVVAGLILSVMVKRVKIEVKE